MRVAHTLQHVIDGCDCPMRAISTCVWCGRFLRHSRRHADTCSESCYGRVLRVQRTRVVGIGATAEEGLPHRRGVCPALPRAWCRGGRVGPVGARRPVGASPPRAMSRFQFWLDAMVSHGWSLGCLVERTRETDAERARWHGECGVEADCPCPRHRRLTEEEGRTDG